MKNSPTGVKQRNAPKGGQVRMKDIAQDLGLSTVTMSKALRGHPDIAEETRKRILKRMKELHYQPNFAARALITGRTWTIAWWFPACRIRFLRRWPRLSRLPFAGRPTA
jgi:DNA-binding LacI/PurR family transcriptional regulator